ncbi:hypothetical protein F4561_006585 [Lipingzhangella halophila]|uniref:Uncharacterized protein n=1 Tax=Lipingzhangella halophila TaxID=1783352 RepID=A0A7W7RPD6_9ACTN|nr:hypothetical protein [Lipingzhangella halophila]MBB4935676.1 hypothetical protein [Lipingzhangella halophila]
MGAAHTSTTATIHIRLHVHAGAARVPTPTAEHGGIHPIPHGCIALVDIGHATHIAEHDAHLLAGALTEATHVDVVGTTEAVPAIRAAIAIALDKATK